MPKQKKTASARPPSPLFEPSSSPPPPYRPRSAPKVAGAKKNVPPTEPQKKPAEVDISVFIGRLHKMESDAKAEFAKWQDLGLITPAILSAVIPTKRKASEQDSDSESDSDADSDDEDADVVAPHDPAKLIPPRLPMYHPGFQLTEELAKEILQVLVDFLKAKITSGYNDKEAEILWTETIKTRQPTLEAFVRIAITGDTGSGKSATLNSLLGVDNLTPEGDNGGAVTNVVTEFQKKLTHQSKPITAYVQFFCAEWCMGLVRQWYTDWLATQQKEDDEIDDNDKARKEAALDCLTALFANKVTEPFENYLTRSTAADETKMRNKLEAWTANVYEQFVKDGETSVEFGAITHSDMREQLRPFRGTAHNAMYKGQRLSFSPWPFVEIVRYHLDNPILEQGNRLADVPGANDINVYRVKTANEYMQTCEMTMVVGAITRVLSEATFRQHCSEAHRRRYHGSIILCATRSDEMNDDGGSTLHLDEEAEKQLAPIEEEMEDFQSELSAIEQRIEVNKAQMKRLQKKFGKESSDDGLDVDATDRTAEQLKEDNKAMKARKKEIPLKLSPLEKKRRDIRIGCRNRQVAAELDQRYRADTGDDGGAVIFCLSNRMYMRHVRGYNRKVTDKVPTMSLETTQVPAACKHIYGIPSQGKTAVLEHFVMFTIPAHLDIVQMSCSRSTESRVNHVIKIVDLAIKNLEDRIDALKTHCSDTFVKELVEALSGHELQEKFDRYANASLNEFAQLAAPTHKAVCNHRGIYSQKKNGGEKRDIQWNEKLLAPVRPDIERAFRKVLDEACPQFEMNAAQIIKKAFRDLNSTLKDDPQALAGDAYQLCVGNSLVAHEANISHHVKNAASKLKEGINLIRQKATKAKEDDFFYDGMIEIYDKALGEKPSKGKTATFARHDYLKRHIPGENGPFRCIIDFTREDANAIIEDIRVDLHTGIVKIFKQIRSSFERQKTRKENDTEEGQRFRKELHGLVEEARRVLNGVVTESLERCKAHK